MNRVLRITAAFAAGMAAMYCLDATLGRRRRAMLRDKVIRASHRASGFLVGQGKRIADRAKGIAATGNLERISSREPQSDAQLRERVLSRLGHWVSHPAAIQVEVENRIVRLSGQVLLQELDGLLSRLKEMPGVRKIHNALAVLSDPSGFSSTPSYRAPAPP
jgi:osmotically-inducible protein OsmY